MIGQVYPKQFSNYFNKKVFIHVLTDERLGIFIANIAPSVSYL